MLGRWCQLECCVWLHGAGCRVQGAVWVLWCGCEREVRSDGVVRGEECWHRRAPPVIVVSYGSVVQCGVV